MGYYTYFTITPVHDPDDQFNDFMKELGKKSDYWEDENGPEDCIKWYDWQSDCQDISKHYPNLLVEITGDGEEPDDFWYARIKNGDIEYHNAIILYPPIESETFMSEEELQEAKNYSYEERILRSLKKSLQ